MKKTQKLYALILAGLLCLSLAACGGSDAATGGNTDEAENAEPVEDAAEEETAQPEETEIEAETQAEPVKADAENMQALFLNCVGFGDTTEPAVKEAEAVYALVSCAQALNVAGMDEDATAELRTAIYEGYQALDDVQRAEFDANFSETLNSLANDAVEDYQSVADLFENAGLDDEMSALTARDNVVANWTTFGAYIVTRNAGNNTAANAPDDAENDTAANASDEAENDTAANASEAE